MEASQKLIDLQDAWEILDMASRGLAGGPNGIYRIAYDARALIDAQISALLREA